jgi:protein involved in polysaccharide export with SLBB domain
VVDAYEAVKTGKGLEEPLQENDFITVPENRKRIMVVEAVNRPGEVVVPERERLTVLEAINAAGGLRPDAKTTEIALLRQVSKEKTERTLIPLKDLSQGKNLALANLTLRDGDMIVVPQTRLTPSLWQRTSQLFGVFNLARGLFF